MQKLSDILSVNRDLIRNKKLDELYVQVPYDLKATLSNTLYLFGVDPTSHFKDSIPAYFTYGCGTNAEYIPANIILPRHIKAIESSAFCNNSILQRIAMPGVEVIQDQAFHSCENLKSVAFGDKLYKIGQGAFSDCYELTELYLPASVEFIYNYAFEDCIGIRKVHYAGTMEDWSYNRVYSTAFKGCKVYTVQCTDGVTDLYV